jgi:hypothetical protein
MRKSIALIMMLALMSVAAVAPSFAEPAVDRPAPQATTLDLSKSFHTRSPWRLAVTEGPRVKDYGDHDAPGALTLCLHKGPTGPCISDPVTPPLLKTIPSDPTAWAPHYLITARPVYPRGPRGAPFLLIVTASLYSGDGDQVVFTQLVAYDAERDTFRRVYVKNTGHNNNQEIRFVANGPLQGSVISAEPQQHAPYGFWITVDQLTPAGAYRQALRTASATRYGDGNPLAVIDSEMPNIQRQLGLWKPGRPIPVPGGRPCPKPVLKHGELWCS